MKTILAFLLLVPSCFCSAQTFGVKDFLLTQKSQDFELVGHFPINYHDFHYNSDITEGDCKGYQFKNGSQQLDIMRCPIILNGEGNHKFIVFYKISMGEFAKFKKSLIDAECSI